MSRVSQTCISETIVLLRDFRIKKDIPRYIDSDEQLEQWRKQVIMNYLDDICEKDMKGRIK